MNMCVVPCAVLCMLQQFAYKKEDHSEDEYNEDNNNKSRKCSGKQCRTIINKFFRLSTLY